MSEREVIIRFGFNTPYWPLSMTYGMLYDPSQQRWFGSLDHWLGYHMFVHEDHKHEVFMTPNGWIAMQAIHRIMHSSGSHALDPAWPEKRDQCMMRGLCLKIGQNTAARKLLSGTRKRRLVDESRAEDLYWCNADGRGRNRHAELLTDVRDMVHRGVSLETVDA